MIEIMNYGSGSDILSVNHEQFWFLDVKDLSHIGSTYMRWYKIVDII